MYGMGDAIREYQEDVRKLTNEVKGLQGDVEKSLNYITSLEFACSHILDWYWNIDEPGLLPDSAQLRSDLRLINKILMNYRGNVNKIKERINRRDK